jgi:fido (protein-threonine AMPylation protein)
MKCLVDLDHHRLEGDEREHLEALMRDFPAAPPLSLEEAIKSIHIRFEKLDFEQFSSNLRGYDDRGFVDRFQNLPRKAHRYLYQDILSNAGEYRKSSDPENGEILFGPRQRFRGWKPENIAEGVNHACSLLQKSTSTPIENVVTFYQQFVCVHPFYDANGRIARFMTSIYLDYHGYHMSWSGLRKNQQWLKKLNDCHVRMKTVQYRQYLEYLFQHWQRYISLKDSILGEQ